jgi:hypothetical protein
MRPGEIGDADSMNGRIGGLEVGFGHWRPHGEKSSKNVDRLRHQREKRDRDTGGLRSQFVIVIKKHDIRNISRRKGDWLREINNL